MKKKEPMRGEIMRCIDESMIYHFMQKYDGFSMSAEAILALVGNAMGTAIITLDADNVHSAVGAHDAPPPDGLYEQSSIHNLLASQSMELSHCSMINNYKSFGRRLPSPKAALSGFERIMSHTSILRREDDQTTLAGHFHASPDRTGQRDPVRGMMPRMYSSPVSIVHRAPATDMTHSLDRTLASGYRLSRPNSPDKPSVASTSKPMAVMSSQHLRRVAKEMGFNISQHVTDNDVLAREAEQFTQDEAALKDEIDGTAGMDNEGEKEGHARLSTMAISVMHEQLLEEGSLPSLLPASVLSADQLDELGKKKKTWDDIFSEVSRKGRRQKSHPAGTELQLVTEEQTSPTHANNSSDMLNQVAAQASSMIEGQERRLCSPINQDPTKPNPLPFFGSLAQRQTDKERMHSGAESEQHNAENRLVLPTLRPPEQRALSLNPYVTPLKLLTMKPKELAELNTPLLAKAPRALKARGREHEQGGQAQSAKSPFLSWAEEVRVLTSGIPSGAGMRLYRSKAPQERYHRASRVQRNKASRAGPKAFPFVSTT